jgi:hypothetical protein
MQPFSSLAVAGLLVVLACGEATAPELRADQRIEGVEVTLTASSLTVSPGEEVVFTVSAHNTTADRAQIGFACGPAMDVLVARPSGRRISVLALAAGGRLFSCELGEEHFADPGETETLQLTWRPTLPGDYTAVGALRGAFDILFHPTDPITITVR